MFFLSGVARYLFVPMAEAVVFAMLASYFLSRTLVPTMAKYLLQEHDDAEAVRKRASRNPFTRFQHGFERGFERFRHGYLRLLTLCVDHAGRLPDPAFWSLPWPRWDWRRCWGRTSSLGRLRPVHDSRARAHRHAHRGDRRALRPRGGDHPPGDSRRRTGYDPRQHRPALLCAESFLLHLGAGGPVRCRHSGAVEPGSSSQRGVRRASARGAGPRIPRRNVLRGAGGHRDADSELRPGRRRSTSRSSAPISMPTAPWPSAC